VRIFKNKWFARFARQNGLSDRDLCEAVDRAERGLVDADLGGGVIKQRIARPNEGRSGGFRSIIYFRTKQRTFFVFGFAKNALDNISGDTLNRYRRAAQITLDFDEDTLKNLIETEELTEVNCDAEELQK
jgi:hypothetical protein